MGEEAMGEEARGPLNCSSVRTLRKVRKPCRGKKVCSRLLAYSLTRFLAHSLSRLFAFSPIRFLAYSPFRLLVFAHVGRSQGGGRADAVAQGFPPGHRHQDGDGDQVGEHVQVG